MKKLKNNSVCSYDCWLRKKNMLDRDANKRKINKVNK